MKVGKTYEALCLRGDGGRGLGFPKLMDSNLESVFQRPRAMEYGQRKEMSGGGARRGR